MSSGGWRGGRLDAVGGGGSTAPPCSRRAAPPINPNGTVVFIFFFGTSVFFSVGPRGTAGAWQSRMPAAKLRATNMPKRPRGGVRAVHAGFSRGAPLFPLLLPALPHAPRSHAPPAPTLPRRLGVRPRLQPHSLFLFARRTCALAKRSCARPPPPPHVSATPALPRPQGTAFGLPRGHARLCVPMYPHALSGSVQCG